MQIRLGIVKPDPFVGKQIVKIGFSPFLILATDSIIIIALNAVLQYYGGGRYGDTLITAATIVQSYMLLITSPMLGITGGSQPLISFNYGAKQTGSDPEDIFLGAYAVLLFYSGHVPDLQIHAPVFCAHFYRRAGICGARSMGHQSVYADDRSVKFSICDRGRADCSGNDKDISEPISGQGKGSISVQPASCRFYLPPGLLSMQNRCATG